MDENDSATLKAVTRLKTIRAVFAVAGVAFAGGAIAVAVTQVDEAGLPAAIGIAAFGILLAVMLSAGVWFAIGRFLESIQDMAERRHDPRFGEEPTRPPDQDDGHAGHSRASISAARSTPQLNLDVEVTATVVVHDVEETLALTAAHLFTRDDMRGNVDLVVAALPGHEPDRLTEALLQNLQLEFEGRDTRLSPLAHEDSDPDGSFLVVLGYSVTDLIGELDRPRLEQWIDKLVAKPGAVSVFWDERLVGTVGVVVAD